MLTSWPFPEYQQATWHLCFHFILTLFKCTKLYLVINKLCYIIAADSRIVYCWIFGQWFNISPERIAYWPKCIGGPLVSKQSNYTHHRRCGVYCCYANSCRKLVLLLELLKLKIQMWPKVVLWTFAFQCVSLLYSDLHFDFDPYLILTFVE